MVKNKIGGNKAKKFARKNINAANENKKIRFATDEDEVYGIVNKIMGNGQFIVLCNDGKERLCFIRNKFSGRNKQSNLVSSGSWVIIGKRSWESVKEGKMEKCDLLEIYSDTEKHRVQQECSVNFTYLLQEEQKMLNVNSVDNNHSNSIEFSYKNNDDNNIISQTNNEEEDNDNDSLGDIDFDDI